MGDIKCFLMSLPFLIKELTFYKLYQELSYGEDDLSFELLNIIKDKQAFHRKYVCFFNHLCGMYNVAPVDATLDDIKEELRLFIIKVMEELDKERLYNEFGRLKFNALWFDHPNSLMFYSMSKNDVELQPSIAVTYYRH